MKELLENLAQFPVDHYGTSWVLASQVVEDTRISRKELWEIIQEIKIEVFLDCVTTCIPSAEGLLSVTITQRGRLWLKGEDYSYLPHRRDKVNNLL
jgi:hypothetical protein